MTAFWDSFPKILRLASMRLKDAQIENQDALKLIERYNKEEVFIYTDPPYPLGTRKNCIVCKNNDCIGVFKAKEVQGIYFKQY